MAIHSYVIPDGINDRNLFARLVHEAQRMAASAPLVAWWTTDAHGHLTCHWDIGFRPSG